MSFLEEFLAGLCESERREGEAAIEGLVIRGPTPDRTKHHDPGEGLFEAKVGAARRIFLRGPPTGRHEPALHEATSKDAAERDREGAMPAGSVLASSRALIVLGDIPRNGPHGTTRTGSGERTTSGHSSAARVGGQGGGRSRVPRLAGRDDATDAICGRMEDEGVSRSDLAGRPGVSRAYVTRVLNTPLDAPPEPIIRLADAAGLQVEVALKQARTPPDHAAAAPQPRRP